MGCINKRERGVRLWSLIGRCVKHFGAQVTDMIEFGSGAIVCRLPAGRQESAVMCIKDPRAGARSVRSSLHLRAHTHRLFFICLERKETVRVPTRAAQSTGSVRHLQQWWACRTSNRFSRWVGQIVALSQTAVWTHSPLLYKTSCSNVLQKSGVTPTGNAFPVHPPWRRVFSGCLWGFFFLPVYSLKKQKTPFLFNIKEPFVECITSGHNVKALWAKTVLCHSLCFLFYFEICSVCCRRL